jgi:FKBP-type peptidyl-prolyl cis-trans isomerase 2
MKVEKGRMVRCEYDLRVEGGEVLESSSKTGPIVYKHGSGKLLPALEEQLEGMEAGDEKSGVIAADAIASADASPTLTVPRSLFPADAKLEVGSLFEAKDPQGRPLKLEVRSASGDQVTARAVHALAGKSLSYRVKILSVREAPPAVPSKAQELAPDDLVDSPPSNPDPESAKRDASS